MEIREILKEYPYIDEEIKKLNKKMNGYLEMKEETRNTLKAQKLSHEPHGTGVSNITLNAVEKIMDKYEEEIKICVSKINDLFIIKQKLDVLISQLTVDERRLIYMYYDERKPINKICYELKYSRQHIYRMKDKIEVELWKKIG